MPSYRPALAESSQVPYSHLSVTDPFPRVLRNKTESERILIVGTDHQPPQLAQTTCGFFFTPMAFVPTPARRPEPVSLTATRFNILRHCSLNLFTEHPSVLQACLQGGFLFDHSPKARYICRDRAPVQPGQQGPRRRTPRNSGRGRSGSRDGGRGIYSVMRGVIGSRELRVIFTRDFPVIKSFRFLIGRPATRGYSVWRY